MFNFKGMFEISPRWLNRNAPDKVTQTYTYRHTEDAHTRVETHTQRAWSKHRWDVLLFLKHRTAKQKLEKRRGKHSCLGEKTQYNQASVPLFVFLIAWEAKMQRQQNWLTCSFIALAFITFHFCCNNTDLNDFHPCLCVRLLVSCMPQSCIRL